MEEVTNEAEKEVTAPLLLVTLSDFFVLGAVVDVLSEGQRGNSEGSDGLDLHGWKTSVGVGLLSPESPGIYSWWLTLSRFGHNFTQTMIATMGRIVWGLFKLLPCTQRRVRWDSPTKTIGPAP